MTNAKPILFSGPMMLAMLRRLEWCGLMTNGINRCPECLRCEGKPHRPDCELAALLKGGAE